MRSAGNLNVKNLPAKSNLKKEKKVLYSSTPIRMGEMEITNLMIAKHPESVEKFMKMYATNEDARNDLIGQLLSPGKFESGHLKNPLDMTIELNSDEHRSVSREILDKYLNVLGYELVDGNRGENDGN